jgi:hypothetical protein
MILIVASVLGAISLLLRLLRNRMTTRTTVQSVSRIAVRRRFWILFSTVSAISGVMGFIAFEHSPGGGARFGFFLPFIAVIVAAIFYGRNI